MESIVWLTGRGDESRDGGSGVLISLNNTHSPTFLPPTIFFLF